MIPKKRLRSDEFSKLVKDYPEVENLIYALNQTRDETAKTLDSRLSIKQNLNQELKDVTIGDQPVVFRTNIRGIPRGVTAVKSEQICTGGFVNWEYLGNGQIRIEGIAGTVGGCDNKFTLLVVGD